MPNYIRSTEKRIPKQMSNFYSLLNRTSKSLDTLLLNTQWTCTYTCLFFYPFNNIALIEEDFWSFFCCYRCMYAYFVYNVQTHLYSSSFHRRFCSLCTKLIKHVDGWCPITTTCNVSLLNVLTEYDRKSFRLFCCFLSKSKFSNTNPKLINMLIYFSTCPIFQLTWHSIS